jgi:hypothetical protein
MRAIDAEGRETNYYGNINKILEFSFAGNKELKVIFLIVIGLTVITELSRTSSAWWKSNAMNDYGDMTCSSLHTRSSKCIIYLIHLKTECMVGSTQGEPP